MCPNSAWRHIRKTLLLRRRLSSGALAKLKPSLAGLPTHQGRFSFAMQGIMSENFQKMRRSPRLSPSSPNNP
jgi:hypothetical protein